ncbi:MAG: ABC transporter ATP-binding protein [Lachnospiraceae bacterium]|nr:ABC transporter ATP-binding protein [Lachnospiraceae bacterium]
MAENISCGYGGKEVLTEVSFSLPQGSMTGLLGANGSGKSTLLKALCRQIPHRGNCYLEGQSLANLSQRQLARRISYIPQQTGIHASLPLLEVVLMGFNPTLGLLQNPSVSQRNAARAALARVGLGGMENADYLTLSEGQKQLCILARTIVEDTSLLLLDEPDSALDFHNRYYGMGMLQKLLLGKNKAALICLHDPALALDFCSQLLILKDGKCTASLHPASDSLPRMKEALSDIYGPISLIRCTDSLGQKRLMLLSELVHFSNPPLTCPACPQQAAEYSSCNSPAAGDTPKGEPI